MPSNVSQTFGRLGDSIVVRRTTNSRVQILMLGAHCVNCRYQFFSSIRLHYVTACADTKSLSDGRKLIVLAQEKDFCSGSNSLYLACCFQSIHTRHRNI